MNTMHGALTSSFLLSCLCYAHVLANFVHITKANVKRISSFDKCFAQCNVNILQELKIYRGTSAIFLWSISLNHSFILPGVLEVVVVIKKNTYMALTFTSSRTLLKIVTTIYKYIYTYIYVLLASMCMWYKTNMPKNEMSVKFIVDVIQCMSFACLFWWREREGERFCFCVRACVYCCWHSHVFSRCL